MKRFSLLNLLLLSAFFFVFDANASHKKGAIKKRLQKKVQAQTEIAQGQDLLRDFGGPAQCAVLLADTKMLKDAVQSGVDINARFPDGDSLYKKAMFCRQCAHELGKKETVIEYNNMIFFLENAGAQDAKAAKENGNAPERVTNANPLTPMLQRTSANAAAQMPGPSAASDQKGTAEIVDSSADVKQKKEQYTHAQKQAIFLAIHRVCIASNILSAFKEKQVSDVQVFFAGRNLQRCLEHYAFVMKKMDKSLEQGLFFLNLAGKELIARQYCEILIAMNPSLNPAKIMADSSNYFRKIFTKMFLNLNTNNNVEPLDALVLCIGEPFCEGAKELIRKNVELCSTVALIDAEAMKKNDEIEKLLFEIWHQLDSSLDEQLKIIDDKLDAHDVGNAVKLVSNINAFDRYGYSPLFYAVLNDNDDLAEVLIQECKANPNIRDQYGRCPLLFAWSPKVKRILKENGARIDFQDERGRTALMDACEKGAESVVKALLKDETNFRFKDNEGNTAYDLATSQMRALLDEKWKGEPGRLFAEKEAKKALELKMKAEQIKAQDAIVDPAQVARKEAARKAKSAKKAERRKAHEKEKEEDNKKLLPLKIQSLALVAQKRIRAKAFEQLKRFVKSEKDAQFFAIESDPDIQLRRRALQEAITLYESTKSSDSKVQREVLEDCRNNMKAAGIRFVEYYANHKLQPDAFFAELKQRCERHDDTSACGYDLMVDLHANLQESCFQSESDLFRSLYAQAPQKKDEHAAATKLIDAIRANDSSVVGAILSKKTIDHRKMHAPLACAHLHKRNQIAAQLQKYSVQKPDAKMVAEHLAQLNASPAAKAPQPAQLSTHK